MKELEALSLGALIERVTEERLIDDCIRCDDHVIIVQGSTRFVLDPGRAHTFLRGVIKGMSAEYRHRAAGRDQMRDEADHIVRANERVGLFDTFRRHLVKKWWGRYEEAGKPCGRSIRGLMVWIRYNTETTAN